MNFKRSATGLTAGDIEFVKSRKSSLLMGNSSSEGGYSKRNAMLKGNGTVEQTGLLRAGTIISGVGGGHTSKGHSGSKAARRGTMQVNGSGPIAGGAQNGL
jgi:hypothetical protein